MCAPKGYSQGTRTFSRTFCRPLSHADGANGVLVPCEGYSREQGAVQAHPRFSDLGRGPCAHGRGIPKVARTCRGCLACWAWASPRAHGSSTSLDGMATLALRPACRAGQLGRAPLPVVHLGSNPSLSLAARSRIPQSTRATGGQHPNVARAASPRCWSRRAGGKLLFSPRMPA